MSQEILFLLFMIFEGVFLVVLYQAYLVPKVISPKVVDHWLAEIESGRIDLPSVLGSYTESLIANIDALLFGYPDPDNLDIHGKPKHKKGKIQIYFPQIIGGLMSAGNKQLRADPENAPQVAVADFLDSLDPPARMVANMVLPRIQEALTKGETSPEQVQVKYEPGLSKR